MRQRKIRVVHHGMRGITGVTRLRRSWPLGLTGCIVAATVVPIATARAASPTPTSWSITFTPLATQILVGADATATVLPDGRVRIYWATGDGSVALFYGRPVPFHAYVSLSRDGVRFTEELRVVDEVLDIAAVPRPDGSFLVYYGTYVVATNTSYLNIGKLVFHATPPVPTCSIPDVRSKSLAVAKTLIARRYCNVGTIQHAYSTKLPTGWVIEQHPAASDKTLVKGTKITLIISRGHR